jgi:hypothetical protein
MLGGCADENKKNPSTIQDIAGPNRYAYVFMKCFTCSLCFLTLNSSDISTGTMMSHLK